MVERPPLPARPADAAAAVPIRIGYARCSMAEQEIASRFVALEKADCTKVFQEKISTRARRRPKMEAALALANAIKEAAPDQVAILTVHEMKRLAQRGRADAAVVRPAAGGHPAGAADRPAHRHDPTGMGAMFFAVLAVAAQLDRNYIREKTLEGQQVAAAKGNRGGRPKVIDDDSLAFALALKAKGVPVPEIAAKPVIKEGKNAGKHPSVASVCRALAEAEEAAAAAEADDELPRRPTPVRLHRPDEPLTAEETELRERLVVQRAVLTAAGREEVAP
ncbi:recombinase family protein [Streptomyces sp. NPDC046931]|uniref:recombinase family protein n=1 Tax=Streptomyces sp. NPDC046931 TaxID=3154806 RepID=UPI0033FF8804